MGGNITTCRDQIDRKNLHLAGYCKNYIRLAFASAFATDRLDRRSQYDDSIQDIRLQRQARSLAFRLIDIAYRHKDHDYHTSCTWEGC